mgnify:CR=1 FL=1
MLIFAVFEDELLTPINGWDQAIYLHAHLASRVALYVLPFISLNYPAAILDKHARLSLFTRQRANLACHLNS